LPILNLLSAVLFATLTNARSTSNWCDSVTSVCFQRFHNDDWDVGWGYVFPTSATATEFIGIITAPVAYSWIGADLGGTMANNLLILNWMSSNKPIQSSRYTTTYSQPKPYAGPKVTVLSTSGTNSTYQRFVYRCENCTSWTGASMPLGSNSIFGYAFNTNTGAVTTPSDSSSTFQGHTNYGRFTISLSQAASANYNTYLTRLSGGTTTGPTTTMPPPTTPPYTPPYTPTTTSSAPGPTQTLYGQCGGNTWTGPTVCASGSICKSFSQFYSQCVPP